MYKLQYVINTCPELLDRYFHLLLKFRIKITGMETKGLKNAKLPSWISSLSNTLVQHQTSSN